MTTVTSNERTTSEWVERARSLAPELRARAEGCERDRQVSAATIADLAQLDLFKLLQPRRWGGFEAGLATLLDVAIELGRACPSTSWVYSVLASHSWFTGMFEAEAQEDVWRSSPGNLVCTSVGGPGSLLEPTAGGYVLREGRFAYSSGCDHAAWAIVRCSRPSEDGEPEGVWVLLPRAEWSIDDDWFTAGMRGTGSKTLVVRDAHVPAHRVVRELDIRLGTTPGATSGSVLYRVPLPSGFPFALIGPSLGAVHGLLDITSDALRRNLRPSGPEVPGLAPAAIRLGEVQVRLRAVRGLIGAHIADAMQLLSSGASLSPDEIGGHSLNFSYAAHECVGMAQLLMELAGGSSMAEANPVQRFWRDIHVAISHKAFDWDGFRLRRGQALLAG